MANKLKYFLNGKKRYLFSERFAVWDSTPKINNFNGLSSSLSIRSTYRCLFANFPSNSAFGRDPHSIGIAGYAISENIACARTTNQLRLQLSCFSFLRAKLTNDPSNAWKNQRVVHSLSVQFFSPRYCLESLFLVAQCARKFNDST